jgi:signal transduction histidine kinase
MFDAFWNGSYAPHGYCLFWRTDLLLTHIIADTVIALAYFTIPIALVTLMRRRRDLEFGWIFWCFATFILACGLTHVMSIWTLFSGSVYGLEALVKAVTALASIATAIVLWPLLPKAIALPSPAKLQTANAELAAMIAERDEALSELRAQVAQRERAEEALLQSQKLEAVGQLTGGIAHDFNNLLQAIAGNLELISRKPDDEARVVRWTAGALDAVERGRSLTGQLLAFSRKQKLDLTSVRIAELLAGMRDLLDRAVAPLSTVTVERIDPTWNIEADPLQLELAILNLAFNARDAMPEGGTLTISAERRMGQVLPELPEGDYLALTIADTGHGMSPEVAARALEPFFTTKEVGKGTGMGLSMAFGVLRQSRGSLRIESEPGQGTRITLFLRMTLLEPARDHGDDADYDARIDLTGRTIALIDDDAGVRAALADTLRVAGAEVGEAGDGAHGVALLGERRHDLVVVDFAMPGMSGAEVARQVRDKHPLLPVLIITGFADSETLDGIEGEVTVLKKPFESRELLRRAAELISGGATG